MQVNADNLIYKYLTDKDGNKNAIGNYGSEKTTFYFEADKPASINRIIISIEDDEGFSSQEYGSLGSALKYGYLLQVKDSSGKLLVDFTDGIPVTTNANIARICYDVDFKNWATGKKLIAARFTFANSGNPLVLNTGDRLVIEFQDNFSRLISHYFKIQGYYIGETIITKSCKKVKKWFKKLF